MPKSNMCVDKNALKDKAILKVINSALIDCGINKKALIKKSGIPYATVYADLRKPSAIPLYRLRIYFDVLHIPDDERVGV